MRELCDEAVSAALAAGASYADARVVVRRNQTVATRNQRVDRLDDTETEGLGVRVLVGGAWGFACDRRLSADGAQAAAGKACAFAKAAPGGHSRELAPLEPAQGEFRTAVEQAQAAANMPVDYIAIGPIFSTATKADPDPVLGLDGVRRVRDVIGGIPLVAIGGITAQNAAKVISAGADAVAVISALLKDPTQIQERTMELQTHL